MVRYHFVFCLALLCGNAAMASTIDLAIEDSAGSLILLDEYYLSQVGNSSGSGALLVSPSGTGGEAMSFELSLNTQNTLMTFSNSDLVLQIAESIIVSGEVFNGIYSVTDFQYSWDSCETVQGSDYCDSFIVIAGQSAALTHVGAGFSLTTSASVLLTGYSLSESILLERQFELTQVPIPAAIWLLISAIATVPTMRVFSSKR